MFVYLYEINICSIITNSLSYMSNTSLLWASWVC